MATLSMEDEQWESSIIASEERDLEETVPKPFPKELRQQLLDELAAEDAGVASASEAGPSNAVAQPPKLDIQISSLENTVQVRTIT